jgi:hypothetical protein
MIRSILFALAFLASAGAALVTPAAAAELPCSEYISTAFYAEPGMGYLIGTESRTTTYTYVIQGTPGNIGSIITYTITSTFEVGYYDMGNGNVRSIDCRTYVPV